MSRQLNEKKLAKIYRYLIKKERRCNQKKVRYGCRQNLAKQRYRHQGRFITKEEKEKLDPDQIYDPNMRQAPKVKSIFTITKEHHRSASCISLHSRCSSFYTSQDAISSRLDAKIDEDTPKVPVRA